ncbi:MAG: laccase domain-containing protein [Clostridia bacterium]|nr:laccase domain-containing protein [Clostridia bacterium]
MFFKRGKGDVFYYTSSLLSEHGIAHGFFTRHGGVSSGDFDSLNVSTARKDKNGNCDNPENVYENYLRALSTLGTTPSKALGTHQVHKNVVLRTKDTDAGRGINPSLSEMCGCDGLFLDETTTGVDALCVKTADCVPILLSSKDGKQVSAVHAGWRGTVLDIVTKAAEKFDCPKEDILCAVGPCIGVCCYEVGEEVYEAVKSLFSYKGMENLTDSMFRNVCTCSACSKKKANLSEINKALLIAFGIPEENIDVSGICTCCNEDEFFSHRKSGGFSGTFVSAIRRQIRN